jgi:hypothetical protein
MIKILEILIPVKAKCAEKKTIVSWLFFAEKLHIIKALTPGFVQQENDSLVGHKVYQMELQYYE